MNKRWQVICRIYNNGELRKFNGSVPLQQFSSSMGSPDYLTDSRFVRACQNLNPWTFTNTITNATCWNISHPCRICTSNLKGWTQTMTSKTRIPYRCRSVVSTITEQAWNFQFDQLFQFHNYSRDIPNKCDTKNIIIYLGVISQKLRCGLYEMLNSCPQKWLCTVVDVARDGHHNCIRLQPYTLRSMYGHSLSPYKPHIM